MKIEMRRVTWYSKLIALALFIAMPFFGFFLGMKYQQILDVVADSPAKTPHIPKREHSMIRPLHTAAPTSTYNIQ